MPDILFIDEEKKYVRVEPMVTIGEVRILQSFTTWAQCYKTVFVRNL